MSVYVILGISTIILFRFFRKTTPFPVFGIYRAPGKWFLLKSLVFFVILTLRKFINQLKTKFNMKNSDHAGYGAKSRDSESDMDCRQELSLHPKAIDAVYFNLANKDGWHLLIATAQRPHGVVNGFFILKVPHIGLLLSPKLPDTLLFQENDNERTNKKSYSAEGTVLTPIRPMSSWSVQYKGLMKLAENPDKLFKVELQSTWTSQLSYFDFDTDMDSLCVAKCMALEPWSREYFENLKRSHQTHYEQHGDLKGSVIINEESYNIKLNGMRDHSYGEKREWKEFHRYALHYITLSNGTRIGIGVVCAPLIFSRLKFGYVYTPSGSLHPIQDCDLMLHQHGEFGTPPQDYGFSFKAGGERYDIQVKVTGSTELYIGWEWEAHIIENFITCRVNGIDGWGNSEWDYHYLGGRPIHLAKSDPEWTRNIVKE